MFILDSDHMSLIEHRGSPEAQRLAARISILAEGDDIVTTIISFEEQTRGWLSYLAQARSIVQQPEAYSRFRRMLENYRAIEVLDFNTASAVAFQLLTRQRLRVGTMDLKIAAIALAHDAILITRNLADFRQVPGLKIEDWTIR